MNIFSGKKFNFFESKTIQDPLVEDKDERKGGVIPHLGIQSMDITFCGGKDHLIIGDVEGNVHIADEDFNIVSFPAHNGPVCHVIEYKNSKGVDVLITVGGGIDPRSDETKLQSAQVSNTAQQGSDVTGGHSNLSQKIEPPMIKIWNVAASRRKSTHEPTFLQEIRVVPEHSKLTASVTAFDVAQIAELSYIAVGFSDGIIALFTGDFLRDKSINIQRREDFEHKVTNLGFSNRVEAGRQILTLFATTSHEAKSYKLLPFEPIMDWPDAPCDRFCAAFRKRTQIEGEQLLLEDHPSEYNSIMCVGELVGLNFFVVEDKIRSVAVDGTKICIACFSGQQDYHAVASEDENRMTTLRLFDLENKLIAFDKIFHGGETVRFIVPIRDTLYVITSLHTVLVLKEKDIRYKLESLCSNDLYDIAVNLANQAGYSKETIAKLIKKHGDSLYETDPDNAIIQYCRTIGFEEPSYIIRKFLNMKNAKNLAHYLELLHLRRCANEHHTILLINCYVKLNEKEMLRQFIHGDFHALREKHNQFLEGEVAESDFAGFLLKDCGTPRIMGEYREYVNPSDGVPCYFKQLESSYIKLYREEYAIQADTIPVKFWWISEFNENHERICHYFRVMENADEPSNIIDWEIDLSGDLPKATVRAMPGPSVVSLQRVEFTVDAAISVLREAGCSEEALYLAGTRGKPFDKLKILVEDQRRFADALNFIRVDINTIEDVESALIAYGKRLVDEKPDEFTISMYNMCRMNTRKFKTFEEEQSEDAATTNITTKSHLSIEDFIHLFIDHPAHLRMLLTQLCHECSPKHGLPTLVWDTLLELCLREMIGEYKDKCYELEDKFILHGFARDVMFGQESRKSKLFEYICRRIIRNPNSKMDSNHALLLVQSYSPSTLGGEDEITRLQLVLYEKLGMNTMTVLYHLEQIRRFVSGRKYDKASKLRRELISACQTFGSKDADLWIQLLAFFAKTYNSMDQTTVQDIIACLAHIDEMNLLPPLLVIETLAQSEMMPLSVIKPFIERKLREEADQTRQYESSLENYRKQTSTLRDQVQQLQTQPVPFNVTKCSNCDKTLRRPTFHFLCDHSFCRDCVVEVCVECSHPHSDSYGSSSSCEKCGSTVRRKMCPKCKTGHLNIRQLREGMEKTKIDRESFHDTLKSASDGFTCLTEFVGKGIVAPSLNTEDSHGDELDKQVSDFELKLSFSLQCQ
eukprot:TRINITY_DN3251_c0_g1_i3.p1 TRINITY_DN3251_c0_g1~~TRINITY_DN3251_c0_g1_i3.p1  ORF type:complete len:1204 (-),score=311.48 TRINITY_DN3251_c0_g1_i3:188-3799(-)